MNAWRLVGCFQRIVGVAAGQLKQITIRVDTAGSHHSARKNPAEFRNDIDAIRKDFSL
jgi:hypothetical protein